MQLHPQEGLFQKARALQGSPAFAQYCQLRVVVEHRLARLVQLGIRQARYFGRPKTKFKLDLAATVANLTLMADKIGLTGDPDPEFPASISVIHVGVDYSANLRSNLRWILASITMAWLLVATTPKRAFRLNFQSIMLRCSPKSPPVPDPQPANAPHGHRHQDGHQLRAFSSWTVNTLSPSV